MTRGSTLIAVLLALASIARAEVLAPASPIALGKWAVASFGVRQTNVNNNSSLTQTAYGLDLSYGLADRTQLDLAYEAGSFSGVPGLELSLRSFCVSMKYALLLEAPVSLAVGANYTAISQQDNFAGSPNGSAYGLKIVVSKVFPPFIPYACLNRAYTSLAGESSATEATLGGVLLLNNDFSVSAENTWQMQSAGYTSGQICGSLNYSL